MAEQIISLIKGDKVASNVDYRDALPVNVSAVNKPLFNKVQGYMLQDAGLTAFSTTAGLDRGGIWNERYGAQVRISGTRFLTIAENGDVTDYGEITGSGQVSLPYSFQTQAIIADGKYYLADPVNGLRQITDVDLGFPIDGVWVDGYYFFTDGEYIYHTRIGDEESIDPLQFATSEFSPDPTKGVSVTTDDKVIVWNRYTTEYFVNAGTENFAFSRIPSRSLRYGIVGTHCKCQIGGQFYFMGNPKEGSISVYALGVGAVEEIASRQVVILINQYDEETLSSCVLESRIENEQQTVIVHLPNETLKFNVNIAKIAGKDQAWSLLQTGTVGGSWRGINGVFDPRLGRWVYGDKLSNTLAILDNSVATQYGVKTECKLFTPFVYLETASIDELDIETIPGFNFVDDATVFFSLTYDGLFYSMEHPLQYGSPGQYSKRFMAFGLGYVNNFFSFRLRWVSESRMCFSVAGIKYG